ncbi:hypothetical protein TIFTF001_001102 [Ficus carica]|uniref:Uncharacterized protein n=1 Tax=Ficus carica TaxID=3494 RepID=A0AA87YYG1_FICCA|nr:hypothetical protein TIFTF001_001102 [Ficus carica]
MVVGFWNQGGISEWLGLGLGTGVGVRGFGMEVKVGFQIKVSG